jgi:hypothetical protein
VAAEEAAAVRGVRRARSPAVTVVVTVVRGTFVHHTTHHRKVLKRCADRPTCVMCVRHTEERRFGEGGGGRGRGGGGRGRDREGGERQGSNITLASFLVPSRSAGRRRGDN